MCRIWIDSFEWNHEFLSKLCHGQKLTLNDNCRFTLQTSVNVAITRLDPSKGGWEGADRFFWVYEWKHAQFSCTEPLKPTLNHLTCFESLFMETRTPKHCVLLVWKTNWVKIHHGKRESLSTQSVAVSSYLPKWPLRLQILYSYFIDQNFKCKLQSVHYFFGIFICIYIYMCRMTKWNR